MSVDVNFDVLRGLNNTGMPENLCANTPVHIFWTNLSFGGPTPSGDDPVTLILKMLMSTGWDPTNSIGTNYDVFEPGVGLGIPADQIDIQSFTDVWSGPSYDRNLQLGYAFISPVLAKQFIEEELCKPFGIYLSTGVDGLIRCVQPRHPQKFYIGAPNIELKVGGIPHLTPMFLPVGIFTGDELAHEVTAAFQRAYPHASLASDFCTYDPVEHRFSVGGTINGDSFALVDSDDPKFGSAWPTLGWPSLPVSGGATLTSQTRVGELSSEIVGRTLTEDDMWGVQVVDNRADQITSVVYEHNFDYSTGIFQEHHPYYDPRSLDFNGTLGPFEYRIKTKGIGFTKSTLDTVVTNAAGDDRATWYSYQTGAPDDCAVSFYRHDTNGNPNGDPPIDDIPGAAVVGVDPDAWAQLVAYSIMDRYRQPPLKFRAHLKWKWNTLQIGDVVRVNYQIPGVLVDLELNRQTLDNRLFEIIELHVNFDGSLDATFLGHKHVTY